MPLNIRAPFADMCHLQTVRKDSVLCSKVDRLVLFEAVLNSVLLSWVCLFFSGG